MALDSQDILNRRRVSLADLNYADRNAIGYQDARSEYDAMKSRDDLSRNFAGLPNGGTVGDSSPNYAALGSMANQIPSSGGYGDVAKGAIGGAAAGSSFGPYGTLIGAGVGTVGAVMGAKANAEQRRKAALQRSEEGIAGIQQASGVSSRNSLQDIVSSLRSAFLGGGARF